jgi:group I intron endonuclease
MEHCGIYCIKNIKDKKLYVGSSIRVNARMRKHKLFLRRNGHGNKHLQNAWNKYGEKNFVFHLLEQCEVKELKTKEQNWIDKTRAYDRNYGYNKAICSDSPSRGTHLSEDTKKKLSELGKNRIVTWGDKISESLRGRKLSKKSREKIAKAFRGKKLSDEHKKAITEGMKKSNRVYKRGYMISEEQKRKIKISMKRLAKKKLLWKQNL